MSKICVFPNDPLDAYYKKGEVKERYFNPENMFDEIHVITLADSDIAEEKVKPMAGRAVLKIHAVGKINLTNYYFNKKRVLQLIQKIKPDIIRAYNPLLAGWLGAYSAKNLHIPLVVSLHGNYDKDNRYQARKHGDYSTYVKLLLTGWFIEPYVLKHANKVICIYNSVVPYARKYGARDIEIIHNRVNLFRFSVNAEKALLFEKPTVISVGRLIKEKNQECLIRAIQGLDIHLILIGDGPLSNYLQDLAKNLGVDRNITFLKSVPHSEIHKYYASANIFALPIKYGGFAIPVLEAMASGLPVVAPKRGLGEEPEIIDDAIMLVENTPESFKAAFQKLLSNQNLMTEMSKNGLAQIRELDGSIMERKEADLYNNLIGNSGRN